MKVEVEELESLLGPDDLDVDVKRIIEECKGQNGWRDFRYLQLRRSE